MKDRDWMERAVAGALRQAIRAHGPITADLVPSASKRIVGQLVKGDAPVGKGNSAAASTRGDAGSTPAGGF